MSYVVHIWEPSAETKAAKNITELSEHLSALQQEAPGQNPKFIDLVSRLTARFPASPEGDEEITEDQFAWVDWPLDGETDDAVYSLGINTGMLDDVRPFVIEQTLALGLAFMDEQTGEAWLPGGIRLAVPQASKPLPASTDEEELTAKELGKIVADHIAPLLAEYGYKRRKGSLRFKNGLPGGWREIWVENELRRPSFGIVGSMRLHVISDLSLGIFYPQLFLEGFIGIPTCSEDLRSRYEPQTEGWALNYWMDDDPMVGPPWCKRYEAESRADIPRVLDHLVLKLKTRLLPLLDQCKTVQDYDHYLNPKLETEEDWLTILRTQYFFGTKILTAYLAHNPVLERMCHFYGAVDPLLRKNERINKVIEYVRTHPVPPEFDD